MDLKIQKIGMKGMKKREILIFGKQK